MDAAYPRYSTSDSLLEVALDAAGEAGAETRLLRANTLKFRHCEGYYSKSAQACTWPCSITQMDADDQMEQVYEALVFWCDVVILSSPIRWGSASSLYFKLIERMNCIQNQVTIRDNVLIRNKVAAFIITGGQDNVQAVAGQMLMFFSELGFDFPQFPFIAHSRGWSAEDMERNVTYVKRNPELREGARALARARGGEGAHSCWRPMRRSRRRCAGAGRRTAWNGGGVAGRGKEHRGDQHRSTRHARAASRRGPRIGTVRRPPRGVPKSEYASRDYYDVWLPELSPSEPLVKLALKAAARSNGSVRPALPGGNEAPRRRPAARPAGRALSHASACRSDATAPTNNGAIARSSGHCSWSGEPLSGSSRTLGGGTRPRDKRQAVPAPTIPLCH